MAQYPLPIGLATQINVLDDMQVDRSIDGTPRIRTFYTAARREWAIDHPVLNAGEAATFWNWYNTNRNGTVFQIAPDCNNPTVLVPVMISAPPTTRYLGAGLIAAILKVTEAQ